MRTSIPIHLADHELVSEMKRFASNERESTAHVVAHLAEFDARRLYRGAGFSSLFMYCREVLLLSESEAYNRIEAARAAKRFPVILGMLAAASVNLTTVRLLAPHLTDENHQELLAVAAGCSKRDVEELVACRFPRPDVAASVRKLPVARAMPMPAVVAVGDVTSAPSALAREATPAPRLALEPPRTTAPPGPAATPRPASSTPAPPLVTPLAADRYQIKFTADAATCEMLRLAQDLLRHAVPTGDPAEIVKRALKALIEDVTRRKCGTVQLPRGGGRPTAPGSRHVPADVRRVVWLRDRGHCQFVGASGRRCKETAFLEFHHVEPHGVGGAPTVDNIQLRCRAHNGYEAELFYGARLNSFRKELPARRPTERARQADGSMAGRA